MYITKNLNGTRRYTMPYLHRMSYIRYHPVMTEENSIIYGKHAVKEALTMRPDIVRVVYIQTGSDDAEILAMTKKGKIPCREVNAKRVGKLVGSDAVHQGLIAEIDSAQLVEEYDDFITKLTITPDTALVVLGEVQDPHNVGAIIRSAAAFGISGVLIPEHRQAQVNVSLIITISFGQNLIAYLKRKQVGEEIRELGLEGQTAKKGTPKPAPPPELPRIPRTATGSPP